MSRRSWNFTSSPIGSWTRRLRHSWRGCSERRTRRPGTRSRTSSRSDSGTVFAPFSEQRDSLRRMAGASLAERLDPWQLAPKVGLRVVNLADVLITLDKTERIHLLRTAERSWSGGVYPRCLPDGSRVCILNPNHSRRRQKVTLMEKVTHVHLRHEPLARPELSRQHESASSTGTDEGTVGPLRLEVLALAGR
jgi:hypothetical protein